MKRPSYLIATGLRQALLAVVLCLVAARYNGLHTLTIELYKRPTGNQKTWNQVQSFTPVPLKLHLDNHPVEVSFDKILLGGRVLFDKTKPNAASECAIVDLSGGDKLSIEYTARHSAGYLGRYYLAAVSNSGSARSWVNELYTGSSLYGSSPLIPGGSAGHPDNPVEANFVGLSSCAYIFDLVAEARTTNGYGRINWKHVRQTFYIKTP